MHKKDSYGTEKVQGLSIILVINLTQKDSLRFNKCRLSNAENSKLKKSYRHNSVISQGCCLCTNHSEIQWPSAHLRRCRNPLQPTKGTGNNKQFLRGRRLYRWKLALNWKTVINLSILHPAKTHKLIFCILRHYYIHIGP